MVDGIIAVTQGAGANVETAQITRSDGIVVQRERVEIPDQIKELELLAEILAEQRITNWLLAKMLDMGSDELLELRTDGLA